MFELTLKILSAISMAKFKGDVSIRVQEHRTCISIVPALSRQQLEEIPDSAKQHCIVHSAKDSTVIAVSL